MITRLLIVCFSCLFSLSSGFPTSDEEGRKNRVTAAQRLLRDAERWEERFKGSVGKGRRPSERERKVGMIRSASENELKEGQEECGRRARGLGRVLQAVKGRRGSCEGKNEGKGEREGG
jgi:hypothetical protein